jgi:hypothetical protein
LGSWYPEGYNLRPPFPFNKENRNGKDKHFSYLLTEREILFSNPPITSILACLGKMKI